MEKGEETREPQSNEERGSFSFWFFLYYVLLLLVFVRNSFGFVLCLFFESLSSFCCTVFVLFLMDCFVIFLFGCFCVLEGGELAAVWGRGQAQTYCNSTENWLLEFQSFVPRLYIFIVSCPHLGRLSMRKHSNKS